MIEIILLVLVVILCAGWLVNFIRAEHWKTEAIKWQIAAHQWHASSDKHRALWRDEQDKHAVTNPVHPGIHSDASKTSDFRNPTSHLA